jgi:thiosulfate/3-mercaptopyruvate sulfurtransferase
MTYAHPEYLIEPATLEAELDDPNLRLFDATVFLSPGEKGMQVESGQAKYETGRIPGAAFMDLVGDFSDTSTGLGFTLPMPLALQKAFRAAGVSNDSKVVFYSRSHMMWATRAWWLAYYGGHENISVLNGGFARWRDEGRSVEEGIASYPPGDFDIRPKADRFSYKDDVIAATDDPAVCTVNALSPDVYQGTGAMHYGRKGHIPKSMNVFYDDLMDDGVFKDAADLKASLKRVGMLDADRVITYCGGGISATIDAFACLLVGKENVSVYDGSMAEWVKDESLDMTLGEKP